MDGEKTEGAAENATGKIDETAKGAVGSATGSPTAQHHPTQAGEPAQQAGAQAITHASDVAQDALARGASLAGEMKDHVAATAQNHKEGLADKLEDVAQAVHRSGEQLEGHQDWLAGLVARGADELGGLASTLRTNDLRGLLGNLEDLARRQPAVFVGASMAAGFAMVRIGKIAASGVSRADLPSTPEVFRERK